MTKEELQGILADHALWLENKGGKRANLQGAQLRWAQLQGAHLQGADLTGAALTGADVFGVIANEETRGYWQVNLICNQLKSLIVI